MQHFLRTLPGWWCNVESTHCRTKLDSCGQLQTASRFPFLYNEPFSQKKINQLLSQCISRTNGDVSSHVFNMFRNL